MFASYLLFAYNHERFIEEALTSALAQDYEPMEVIVTDDCSRDRTPEIIRKLLHDYAGPKRIRFLCNSSNGGLASAINQATSLAQGEVIVVAAGDDVSLPERTGMLVEAYITDPHTLCAFSNAEATTEDGLFLRNYYRAAPAPKTLASFRRPRMALLGATASYHASLFSAFEPLDPRLIIEDRVIPMRAAILGKITYIDKVLVKHREHESNMSTQGESDVNDRSSLFKLQEKAAKCDLVALQNRRADIIKAISASPSKAKDLYELKVANDRNISIAEGVVVMLSKPGFLKKVYITGRVLSLGMGRRFAKQWLSKYFMPARYFRKVYRSGSWKHTLPS